MDSTRRKGRIFDFGPPHYGDDIRQPEVTRVGVTTDDHPSATFDLCVSKGQNLRAGEPLFTDRKRTAIQFTAPVSGTVGDISFGPRRRLELVEIIRNDEAGAVFDVERAAAGDGAALREVLVKSGAWAAFRSRPFGHIPAPDDIPSAIFVIATDSRPDAVDPANLVAPKSPAFRSGAQALAHLTQGPVFICQSPASAPLIEAAGRLKVVRSSGPHPSGLAGTLIHRHWPVSRKRSVWQIGAQDVAAIGDLLAQCRISSMRNVAVSAAGPHAPYIAQVPIGAMLCEVVASEHGSDLVSGPALGGRHATYLGRYDTQITALPQKGQARPAGFRAALFSALPRVWSGATLPMEAMERAWPFDILPVPLMRALAVGDLETAERLGCLELAEEDMAVLTWLCPSGCDYGLLLRRALIALEESAP